MDVREKYPLKSLNTFGVEAVAKVYIRIEDGDELGRFLKNMPYPEMPLLPLGGGSNVLFTRNYTGVVLHLMIKGIRIVCENDRYADVEVMAGENWDDFVAWTVERGWYGLENLSLIPGNTGSCPIQNIGAYGTEAGDCIVCVNGMMTDGGESFSLAAAECRFGYRDSIFKQELKNKAFITSVVFRLQKSGVLNLDYGGLSEEASILGSNLYGPALAREAVCRIRRRKIPDPVLVGSAGSFFRNPVVEAEVYQKLSKEHPRIVHFAASEGRVKLAAAWLIEQCGWKGYRSGDAGVHPEQPLIIVNYGNATGAEILRLSAEIGNSVEARFGVSLEPEVNIL